MTAFKKTKLALTMMLVFSSEIAFSAVNGAPVNIDNAVARKPSPEVTLDTVQEIFGHNLDTTDSSLKLLLLAVGMDHTTNESPNFNSKIGIPFIVDSGPSYWVNRLKSGDVKTEVLVNNALLLLFTKEEIPKAKETALELMKAAADKGYWPANYYVAETTLLNNVPTKKVDGEVPKASMELKVAQDAMARFNECASIGFAPCQFRLGFWLAESKKTLKEGLDVLQHAIRITSNDRRYEGVLDGAAILGAKEIVFKGEEAGIEYVVREQYANFIETYIAQLKNDQKEIKNTNNN